ncbi:MAG: hypothetical protein PHN38_06300 [Sulfurospirillaceae bacterium]|nr:hypothetical protein [Sulfurospirillaceae bacterium]
MFQSIFRIATLLSLLLSFVYPQESIESLLSDYAQKADLSQQTKREGDGFLLVFTRQDLDRMQIKSLKEIIEFIPFLRYNESASGLSVPDYQKNKPSQASRLRVYLNNRELFSPYRGSALQLFGQLDMAYIDHIEIYNGSPSYIFGVEGAQTTIRAYTKDPKREETTLVGGMVGSYGVSETYGYTAESFEDFSYFAYLNHRDLGRKKYYNGNYELSRDKESSNFYALFQNDLHVVEVQAIKGNMDNFVGSSWGIEPLENRTNYSYFYSGWSYASQDKSVKASLDFMQSSTKQKQVVDDFIGLSPVTFLPYSDSRLRVTERMSDMHLEKTFKDADNSLLLGARGRYKNFIINSYTVDFVDVPTTSGYDGEFVSSAYSEATHMINPNNMLMFSAKTDHFSRNGKAQDEQLYGVRLGYVYNVPSWTWKSFIFTSDFAPESYLMFANLERSSPHTLVSEHIEAVTSEITYKGDNFTDSLLFALSSRGKKIVYDTTTQSYKNSIDDIDLFAVSGKHSYNLDASNRVDFNAWATSGDTGKNSPNRYQSNYGGYVLMLNTIGKWDFSNGIFYKEGFETPQKSGFNFNSAITYRHSRNFSIFLKGFNLFGDAIKTDYYNVNPLTSARTSINDVDSFDRSVWLGLEYQF